MKQTFLQAVVSAVLIGPLLSVPEADGVHLVSSQPITGTDNPNNPPIQYVPKMATKLGLPQPQSRDVPEISLTDEALAAAVRQLLESHKRQSAYLERLAALAPKSRIDEPRSSARKSSSKQAVKSAPPSTMPAPESPVVMRPANQRPQPKQPKENVHPPDKPAHPETTTKTPVVVNETFDKEPPSNPETTRAPTVYPNPADHKPNFIPTPCPYHHYVHFVNPSSPQMLQRAPIGPYPQTQEDIHLAYSPHSQHLAKEQYFTKSLPHAYPPFKPALFTDQHFVETVPINMHPPPFPNEKRPNSLRLTSADNYYSS